MKDSLNLIAPSRCCDQLFPARRFAPESRMSNLIRRFLNDNSGATAIEYGLIAGLISVVIITVLGTIGTRLNTKFSRISSALS